VKAALLYVLYLGNLYGTERMALATACGLARDFEPLILSPPGPIGDLARAGAVEWAPFGGYIALARRMDAALARHEEVAFLATRFEQSLIFSAVNFFRRRKVAHYVVVHGGGGKNVYWRNRMLAPLPVRFIAVSPFVMEELVANGIARERIQVIENFLTRAQVAAIPRRGPFGARGVRKVVTLSRTVRDKRVALLLDALDAQPSLGDVSFDVFGDGEDLERLRTRARRHPNVRFLGFDAAAASRIADYDLLLHTAPREPFGLVVLEAMAAGVPALVPDTGGPASIVSDGAAGFLYHADDACDLAAQLLRLRNAPPGDLDRVVANASVRLRERFTEASALERYREALEVRA
jgi:glycosyltransferase involved in cell wall biosynthesis